MPAPTINGTNPHCYRALATAERLAPEEVRTRPTVRTLAAELLHAPSRADMSGLREFAARVGVPA